MTRIRVVHNIADELFMRVYLDKKQILADIPYKAISDYMLVDSGEHSVTASIQCPPGTKCEMGPEADNFFVSGMVHLEPERSYTMVIRGSNRANLLVLEDDLTCPTHGNAHLRFIHAAADIPAVDFYMEPEQGGEIEGFENVEYGNTGYPTYLSVPSDLYKIDVVADEEALGMYLEVQNQQIYTIIVTGRPENIDVLIAEDNHSMCIVL